MPRFLLALLFIVACFAPAPPAAVSTPPDTNIDVQHYVFALGLSDATDEIVGEATVTVAFRENVEAFELDLIGQSGETGMTVTSVTQDGEAVPFTHENDRLRITTEAPTKIGEERTYTIAYRGVPADGLVISQNKYGDRTFFGDNWPNRARHWLPTVDHPSDKATVEFIVTAPDHYQIVGSGALVEATDLPDGLRLTHWSSTAPMATKVMVIGAARFAIQAVDEVDGIPVSTWVYPQDREAGFYDYALAEQILDFFDDHIGPFPYAKLANVQSKTRFGGMENASNIFYSENSVTGNRTSEGLLAHEIAHQWFGDSVTEADWPHIWLSEGFATYFTQLYFEYMHGRDRMAANMRQARDAVATFYHQNPKPVVDTTVTNLMAYLSPNSYQKGAWVLHMLRYRIGTEVFWDGIEAYYKTYRDGNATSEDLRDVMEAASGQDLDAFFEQWLYRPGHPIFEGTWTYDADTQQLRVVLTQTQNGPAFDVPLEIGIYSEDDLVPRVVVAEVDEKQEMFTFDLDLAAAPSRVVLDPNTWLLMEADFGPR